MKEDNTPTVTKRTRTPSRKLRLRMNTASVLKKLNNKAKTVRQKKKEANAVPGQPDQGAQGTPLRLPRLKKNKLAEAPRATTKYKKRQVSKTWLPTHLWHTKRAHMTRPTEPLWRISIPLGPTEKSYRPSHRAAGAHGCIAWDTSYMSTVACRGTETALESMLRALDFSPQSLSAALRKKWKSGTRFATGWIYERDNAKKAIAPVTIVWCNRPKTEPSINKSDTAADPMEVERADQTAPSKVENSSKQKPKLDHQILIRIHPSAFHQLWPELLKVAKMQKPQVLVEDLRFEIGSIDIQGPGSTEALLGVLKPFPADGEAAESVASVWTSLTGLTNPGNLPQNSLLAMNIVDPRLNHPPKQIKVQSCYGPNDLDEILVSWPVDRIMESSRLISHKERYLVCKSLPSQKAINRRRALAPPGQALAISAKDPRLPVILTASRTDHGSSFKPGNSQGLWTLLLPWACVNPVWRSLMYYSLSSGGTPRFGGLNEKQQLAFEQGIPWFPGDLPGTEAGKAWERSESEQRFDRWIRRPPKARIAWETLDLGLGRHGEVGRGWTCDWEYLFERKDNLNRPNFASEPGKDTSVKEETTILTQRQRKAAKAQVEAKAGNEEDSRRRNTSSPESDGEAEVLSRSKDTPYVQLSPPASLSFLHKQSPASLPSDPALMTIRITLLDKGTPTPAARIYRLPSTLNAPTESTEPTDPIAKENPPPTHSQYWSSAPPPGQRPPTTSTATSSTHHSDPNQDLRARWLALDEHTNHSQPTSTRFAKQKTNKFNLARQQYAYPRESLASINVLPKNAPKEILEKYGPNSAFGRGDGEVPKETAQAEGAARKSGRGQDKGKGGDKVTKQPGKTGTTADSSSALDPNTNPAVFSCSSPSPPYRLTRLMPASPREDPWTQHPPCPDPHDLIGFVTSGGYNLAEGHGTAVGAVWAQRVLEGWTSAAAEDDIMSAGLSGKDTAKEAERIKRLCIVRNAGESIARLGIWELCQ